MIDQVDRSNGERWPLYALKYRTEGLRCIIIWVHDQQHLIASPFRVHEQPDAWSVIKVVHREAANRYMIVPQAGQV